MMENTGEIRALFIIVNAGFAGEVVTIAREAGVKGATILNARGEGARHELVLGITVDAEKEMIVCVVDKKTAGKAMAAIKEKAGIEKPAHSVCFTMPVSETAGIHGFEDKDI